MKTKWPKFSSEIPAVVVFGICLAIAGCANGTAPTPSGNQGSTTPVALAISAISPYSNTAGNSAFTLSVSGSNFLSSSVVNFGATAVVTQFVNSTQLTATIFAATLPRLAL
jgi:IPT/TIG domain